MGDAMKFAIGKIVRHKERKTQYRVMGTVTLQCSPEFCKATPWLIVKAQQPIDGEVWVLYQSVDDASLFVRPIHEFEDGRFE
jgi:hypothetical protein